MKNFTDYEYNILNERLISYSILEDIPEEIIESLLKKININPRALAQEKKKEIYNSFDNVLDDYFNSILKKINKKEELPYKINYTNIGKNFGKSINTIKNHINKKPNLKYKYLKALDKIKKQKFKI